MIIMNGECDPVGFAEKMVSNSGTADALAEIASPLLKMIEYLETCSGSRDLTSDLKQAFELIKGRVSHHSGVINDDILTQAIRQYMD